MSPLRLMPPPLLPASAAAFAPRASSVIIVLGLEVVEPWLTQILKRINRIKRPLNTVLQHQKCLTETLSSKDAIWILTSIMVPKAPDSELRNDSIPLIEPISNFQLIDIQAYIVHVDMVHRNEVSFKLTPDTIEILIDYHKEINCGDVAASTYSWLGRELQAQMLHEEFIQAINNFVYRTAATALEGLEEEGVGELLCGRSEEVKNNIMNLFLRLLPPPRVVDVITPRRRFLVQQRPPQDFPRRSRGTICIAHTSHPGAHPEAAICPPRHLVPRPLSAFLPRCRTTAGC